VISFAQIPQAVIAALGLAESSPFMVMVAISVAFFIGCMFVDPIVVILVLTPLFMPLVNAAGLDPVLIGTLVTLQVAIGSATPPFGCDIFTAIAVFRRPYMEVIKGTPPFIFMLLTAAVLLMVFPQIALFIPSLAFG
jgi:TRAP-type C4-dicarboxylate transport system permease large subunit